MTLLQGSFGLSLVCPWFCLGLCLVCVCLVASHNLQIILYIAELDSCLQQQNYFDIEKLLGTLQEPNATSFNVIS
jgi:hypothetical protein